MIPANIQITDEMFIYREKLKDFYKKEEGIQELCRLILTGGVLSKIDIDQPFQVVAHNYAIETLERLGLLDEEGLEDLVRHLLNRGAYKRPIEDNKGAVN